jgi:hypothetical protein
MAGVVLLDCGFLVGGFLGDGGLGVGLGGGLGGGASSSFLHELNTGWGRARR